MTSISVKLIMSAVGLAFVLASAYSADAGKTRKYKKVATAANAVEGKHRRTNLFPAGPLYTAGVYLGDDPDPNIRFQLWRDAGGRLGGEN